VVVVPRATVRHVRAATTGRRQVDAVHGRAEGIDRRHALHVLYAHAPLWALPLMTVRLLVATVLRVLGYVLTRRPLEARDELAAVGRLLVRPDVMARARRSRARTRTQPRSAIRPLFASRRSRIRARLQTIGAYVEGERAPATSRLGALGDAGPEASDAFDDDGASGAGLLSRIFWRPSVLVLAVLVAVTAVAAHDVLPLGGGVLSGGRLLPAPGSAHALWEQYAAAWHSGSVGSADPASPAIALLAALSDVLFGKAWLAVDLLLFGSIPLAGLTAYLAAGRLVRRRSLRVWTALTWALLPVATGAVATGRLDAAVGQIALPPLVVAGARLLSRDPAEAGWRHAWGLGLGLAVVAAFAPLMWALASGVLVLGGLVGLGLRGGLRPRGAFRRLLASVIVASSSFALLLPWSAHVLRHPDLALAGPGRLVADPALADPRLPGLDLLLLSPGGAGLPVLGVTIGLLVAALAALFRDARHGLTVAAWAVAAGSFGVAVALSRTSVTVPSSGAQASVWPGPALQLAGAALVVAALVGGEELRTRLGRTSFGWRQLSAGLAAVLAATVPLAAGAAWLAGDGQDPLRRDSAPVLPAFVRAELEAAPGLRVLALQADGQGVSYALFSAGGNRLGSTDTPPARSQREALDAAVADLLAPSGSPAAEVLSTRAVRYIALPVVPESEVSRQVTAVLDGQTGLVRRGRGDVLLWEVAATASRLTVLPAPAADAARQGAAGLTDDLLRAAPPQPLAGRTHAVVPAGGPGRLLVLAEAADPGWRAELDGRPLPPVTAWGWAAGFALPESGGAVTLRFDPQSDRRTALWLQLAALVVVAALALPGARRRHGLEVADPEPRSAEEGPR
ncbi:MAG: family 2 glycosyl transferase, partial [Frankiales bacterium]|nr:family 2 glycosyl transferase [Frankiales bacterium]